MTKKIKLESPLFADTCGCTVTNRKGTTVLDRCSLHEYGPEMATALSKILDADGDDELEEALESAEELMNEMLEVHGGRATAKAHEVDGIDSYSEVLRIRRLERCGN